MKFLALASLYEQLEETASYTYMRLLLSRFYSTVPKNEIKTITYLTLGRIASEYDDVNLGMAGKMVLRAIAEAYGKQLTLVEEHAKRIGDIGTTAEQFANGRGKITVSELFSTLQSIAQASGSGSQDRKTALLSRLLKNATPLEARYISRIVLGDLRLGAGNKTILDSLSLAIHGDLSAKGALEHAYTICPDIGIIAETFAKHGLRGIKHIKVVVGIPIQMMLCQRIGNLEELGKRTGFPVTIEEKYDGERIQAHKIGKRVVLYSRRLENITNQFPDVVKAIQAIPAKSCILEGEAVAVNPKGDLLPFQIMMQRRRKHSVEEYVKRIPVSLRVFELLSLNGKSLLESSYPSRYALLKNLIKKTKTIELARQIICDDVSCADDFFQEIVAWGGEGIVIKSRKPISSYQAGIRGWHWIKWKPEYVKGMRDTFDLVVVGAYLGRGRRAGLYGALLCAAYDPEHDRFLTVCKLGTGFTDAVLKGLPQKLKKLSHKPARLDISLAMRPDVWVEPRLVVEVAGAELTKSN